MLYRYRPFLLAIFVLIIGTLIPHLCFAQNARTYLHPRALDLIPQIQKESYTYHPGLEIPWYYPGLMEHESCISLKHSKCWNSQSELKNNREQGVGLGQLTRAWDVKGKIRFDNLTEYRKKYPKELWELDWSTFKYRSDLQIRVAILMVRDLEKSFMDIEDSVERMKIVDSAYNGGLSHARKARAACKLTRNCDPDIWYLNVEKHVPKSRAPDVRYGGRSMYDINVGHVRNVFDVRMPKFRHLY